MYALDASSGRVVWRAGVGGLGYTTPAVAEGRVFAGGFDGRMRAFRATSGEELWSTEVNGRLLGAPAVIGPYVFFSTLQKRTYALRVDDGEIAWRLPLGKYTPGIATERTYFLLAERPAHRDAGPGRTEDLRLKGEDGGGARAATAGGTKRRRSRR